jgi:hypothetical protein
MARAMVLVPAAKFQIMEDSIASKDAGGDSAPALTPLTKVQIGGNDRPDDKARGDNDNVIGGDLERSLSDESKQPEKKPNYENLTTDDDDDGDDDDDIDDDDDDSDGVDGNVDDSDGYSFSGRNTHEVSAPSGSVPPGRRGIKRKAVWLDGNSPPLKVKWLDY